MIYNTKLKMRTTSIRPAFGSCRKTGTRKKALIDVYIEGLGVTIMGVRLNYEASLGWVVYPPLTRDGLSMVWPEKSNIARMIAESGSEAYLALSEGELEYRTDYFNGKIEKRYAEQAKAA